MPREQIATVASYEFGPSPTAAQTVPDYTANPTMTNPPFSTTADSLRWAVKKGAGLSIRIEAYEDPITYQFQVSLDSNSWSNVVDNSAVTLNNLIVQPGGHKEHVFSLRSGKDKYLRLIANGRGGLQVRGDGALDEQKV